MNAETATEPVMWRGSGEWVRVTHSPLPETTIQPNRVGTAEGRSVLSRMWSEDPSPGSRHVAGSPHP
jgi:hypothetical protein